MVNIAQVILREENIQTVNIHQIMDTNTIKEKVNLVVFLALTAVKREQNK